MDNHADEIFKLNAFGLLPEHVVRLILAREGLKADEEVKYNGVYTWCEHYCRSYELTNISDVMKNFLDLIQFHKIPINVLLSEIYPTHIVPDNIFLSALAYQADPEIFEPAPSERARRMTLPNPMVHKAAYSPGSEPEEEKAPKEQLQSQTIMVAAAATESPTRASSTQPTGERRKTSGPSGSKANLSQETFHVSQQQQQQKQHALLKSRKSMGDQSAAEPAAPMKAPKSRRGSIAQVSLSGMKRLSHRLSMKKRHTHSSMQTKSVLVGQATDFYSSGSRAEFEQPRGRARGASVVSAASGALTLFGGGKSPISKQASSTDPMQVGQQILNNYLLEQRQRELERQEEERRQLASESAQRKSTDLPATANNPSSSMDNQAAKESQCSREGTVVAAAARQSVKSSRKSFKDFKHISRKIFKRHSSSNKMLQQQSNAPLAAMASSSAILDRSVDLNLKKADKKLLKIKRSETVFETTATGAKLFSNLPTSSNQPDR